MTIRTLTIVAISISFDADVVVAQNLVPNGSFEEYDYCPDYWNQVMENVTDWNGCANSPDFFHSCRQDTDLGVPFNWRGYQEASHGEGYIGVGTYQLNAPNYREFICTALTEALVVGVPVELSMKVALGGFGSYWLYSPKWTTRGIGMLLSTEPFVWSTESPYPNTAHLYMDDIFTDTTEWVQLNATYVPDSSYRYVTVGNFFDDLISEPTILDSVYGTLNGSYVFVDEMCIAPLGMGCDYSNHVAFQSSSSWRISSPFNNRMEITFDRALDRELDLLLSDTHGRALARRSIPAGTSQLDWTFSSLAAGVYILHSIEKRWDFRPIRVLHVSP